MAVALFDVHAVRQQFPALQKRINGRPAIFADGPGGTQVPQSVIDAMMAYLIRDNGNRGGLFLNSQRTDLVVNEARRAVADLINARRPEEIVFGQNMSTLTFQLSRALSRTWKAGDEIILSQLDHNANIDPWLEAAADSNIMVRWLPINSADCSVDVDRLAGLLSERTRLVAFTYASNAFGSITDVTRVIDLAHEAGAIVYVDAVHYAPHGPIDVQTLDCDFLVSSAYKYFGPHVGVLYGKYELLDFWDSVKVRPTKNLPPDKWETGTLNYEGLAGVRSAVDYLATLSRMFRGNGYQTSNLRGRRLHLRQAMEAIGNYERTISRRFLEGAAQIPGIQIFGITDQAHLARRTPTFALRVIGRSPRDVGVHLAQQGIFSWVGHFYALNAMEDLELQQEGGVVRIGFVHYNTLLEVDRVLNALAELV